MQNPCGDTSSKQSRVLTYQQITSRYIAARMMGVFGPLAESVIGGAGLSSLYGRGGIYVIAACRLAY